MKVAVGVDMGGTTIKLGLVYNGAVVGKATLAASSHIDLTTRLDEIADKVDEMLAEHKATPVGIGIAFPGIIDSVHQKVLSRYVKYPDAQDVNFEQWAKSRWNVPVVVENDAKAALVGEWQFGSGKGASDVVLITLGTGVGSAVMINGKLLSGRNFLAGNLGGHMTINVNGSTCNCGNIGCVESEGSTWALAHQVRKSPNLADSPLSVEQDVDFRKIFKYAEQGDRLATEIRDRCLMTWSLGIINMIHAFDPEKVVIGGGIIESHQVILPYLRHMIITHSWVKNNPPELVVAMHPNSAGLLGLYHLLNTGITPRTPML